MTYLSPKEIAAKWYVTERAVQRYCASGDVPGVKKIGRQWLIPSDAIKPDDRRFKDATVSPYRDKEYHYPLFIYSPKFNNRDELSEEENELLDAEILLLEANYIDSITLCRNILSKGLTPSVTFGCYGIIAANCVILGATSEINVCTSMMESIMNADPLHHDDYQLLLSLFNFYCTNDSKTYLQYKFDNLSLDALFTYSYMIMLSEVFIQNNASEYKKRMFEIFCKAVETYNILPLIVCTNSAYSLYCTKMQDTTNREKSIQIAVDIAHDNNWNTLLSKYSNMNIESFRASMDRYGKRFTNKIFEIQKNNLRNVKATFMNQKGSFDFALDPDDREIQLLLFSGLSKKDISIIKNIDTKTVTNRINFIIKSLKLKNEKELIEYTHNLYDM